MESLEKTQRVGLQALHADAEAVNPSGEPALDVRAGDIARVGLERHFSTGRKADRPHSLNHLPHLGSGQQTWRAATNEHRLERTDGQLGPGDIDFVAERLDIARDQPLEHGVGVEVAVLAHPGAEGDMQVEAVNAFHQSRLNTAMNASCGISTLPTRLRRFLPSFCFSSSFRLRVTSPP